MVSSRSVNEPLRFRMSQQQQLSFPNMPVPMGMFMNMSHVPPRFFNKQQGGGATGNRSNASQGSTRYYVEKTCPSNYSISITV